MFDDDRAVEDMIGFVLTFSVIILATGLVTTAGYDQLTKFRNGERLNNAERGLNLMAHNFEQVQQGHAQVRSSEIDLSDGSIRSLDESSLTIDAVNTKFSETLSLGTIQYELGKTKLTYENGAMFRTSDRGYTIVTRNPVMKCTDTQAIVSVVTVNAPDNTQVGSGTVRVTADFENRELLFPINRTGEDSVDDTDKVTIEVDSPRADGWQQFFANSGNWTSVTGVDDTYQCDAVDRVYIRQTTINVSFST